MMFSNQVRQQRWTFAVGQGLLHYEEIRLVPSTCRPITIVYDAGSLSKHKNKNDTAYQSIGKVNRRLARYCDRTIDFLVLSHFHADHYNLMSKLLERNKVRNFVAPLLTKEGNSVKIAALAYQWLSKEQNSNENEIKLIAALVDRGTRGFCEQLFREYEKPDHFIILQMNREYMHQKRPTTWDQFIILALANWRTIIDLEMRAVRGITTKILII